jgi:hypothetical protein
VSAARASADPGTVATVAPEVVPAKRNFFKAAWDRRRSSRRSGTRVRQDLRGVGFLHRPQGRPAGRFPGWLSTAWGYLGEVPVSVWILLAAAGLAWIAWDARDSVKKITESVQTGARQ